MGSAHVATWRKVGHHPRTSMINPTPECKRQPSKRIRQKERQEIAAEIGRKEKS